MENDRGDPWCAAGNTRQHGSNTTPRKCTAHNTDSRGRHAGNKLIVYLLHQLCAAVVLCHNRPPDPPPALHLLPISHLDVCRLPPAVLLTLCSRTPAPAATGIVRPYIMGKEARKGDEPQSLADMMPDWVGYGTLYGISIIPVLLVIGTVLILFYNSLK